MRLLNRRREMDAGRRRRIAGPILRDSPNLIDTSYVAGGALAKAMMWGATCRKSRSRT